MGQREAPGMSAVLDFLGDRAGLVFPESRHGEVNRAVGRAMRASVASDFPEYLRLLETDSAVMDALVAACTVGETYFFRGADQLEVIRREVLPEIMERRTGPLRSWSAGCASGEEAYSLAILLRESGLDRRGVVIGTDVARDRLAQAAEGRYGRWSLRGVPEPVIRRHFTRHGKHYQLAPEIVSSVEFRHLNLAQEGYPSSRSGIWSMDLILCRNVLIYLDKPTVAAVAQRLYDSLRPGGWLFLAPSDPPLSSAAPFETILTDHGIAYRRPLQPVRWSSGRPGGPGRDRTSTHDPAARIRAPRGPSPALGADAPAGPEPRSGSDDRPFVSPPAPIDPAPSGAPASEIGTKPPHKAGSSNATVSMEGGEASESAVSRAVDRVRDLADRGLLSEAGQQCAVALQQHGNSAELLYLHSTLLAEAGHHPEAAAAARRAVYLHGDLAVAHVGLGSALARLGDVEGARRSFRNAARLLAEQPGDEPVEASSGEPASRLLEMTRAQLRLLEERTS